MIVLIVFEGIHVTRQVNQKGVLFGTIGIFQMKRLCFNHMSAVDARLY